MKNYAVMVSEMVEESFYGQHDVQPRVYWDWFQSPVTKYSFL